ncbi:MAG: hypothetical protein M1817_001806 [Caeruleum heppii]|nr:MAG: hypothetical protein M1817_001806 [Caeruleum heppii]
MASQPRVAAKIHKPVFLGVLWGGIAISFCLLLFRIFVRIKAFRKLALDDVLVIFAWALFLATGIIWILQLDVLYDMYAVLAGEKLPTQQWFTANGVLLKTMAALNAIFYTCLWSVKFSFLSFFRKLGQQLRGHQIWWWCVFVCTFAAWVRIAPDLKRSRLNNAKFDADDDNDVITIPTLIMWNSCTSLRRKLALTGIFSLTVFIIIFAVVRGAVVPRPDLTWDLTSSYTWNHLEVTVALIVACLGSFRQLYVSHGRSKSAQPKHRTSAQNPMRSLVAMLASRFPSLKTHSASMSTSGEFFHPRGWLKSSSAKPSAPLSKPFAQADDAQRQAVLPHLLPMDPIFVSHAFHTDSVLKTQGDRDGENDFGLGYNSSGMFGTSSKVRGGPCVEREMEAERRGGSGR